MYIAYRIILFGKKSRYTIEVLSSLRSDAQGWADPLQEKLPDGYSFRPDRDYLLPIPPEDITLDVKLEQNPGWQL